MSSSPRKPRRLSDIVRSIDTQRPISVGSLADEFGDRAFGALMFIFAIPNVIPAPPGTSAISCLALGLAERDGAAVLGYCFAAGTVILLGFVSSALYAAARAFVYSLIGI
jgi:hypothetical protein